MPEEMRGSPAEAIRSCLNKYATIQGRARWSEYWYFYLFNFLLLVGLIRIIGVLVLLF